MSFQCPLCQRTLGLTKRRWLYVEQIYKGRSDKEIASHFGVSVRTVRGMVEMLRDALGMRYSTRGELILKCKALLIEREKLKK